MHPTSTTADDAERLRIAAHDKRIATYKARAALRGITLNVIEGDNGKPEYIMSRGPLTKALDSLDAVESWLAMVTGA